MKITKKLAAITAAIVMSVSTMAVSASAKTETRRNNSIQVSNYTNSGGGSSVSYSEAKNLTGITKLVRSTIVIYNKSGGSTDPRINSASVNGNVVNSGTATYSTITADYSIATGVIYNGTVISTGELSTLSVKSYF